MPDDVSGILFRIKGMRKLPQAIVLGFLLIPSLAFAEKIKLCADMWMPFNGCPTAEKPGYVVEVVREIFKASDIEVDYSNMAWADALKAATEGGIDGVIGANSEEAKPFVVPTEPVGKPDTALFVHKSDTADLNGSQPYSRFRIGVCDGYSYWPTLDKYLAQKPKNVRVFSGEAPLKDAIDAMEKDEIDAIPENRPVFIWALKEKGLSPAAFRTAFVFDGDPIFVAFSARNARAKDYAEIFDKGIKAMRASGRLAEILKRYCQTDWQQ
jgi:polar amino acid transport system substrate-binding protein